MSQRVDYEGELAIVIGKKAANVSPQVALDYVFGYTCFNDVTARDLQAVTGSGHGLKGLIISPRSAPGLRRIWT